MRPWTLLLTFSLFAATTLSNAADRVNLSGKVADATGKPLNHATVLVYHAGVRTGYSTFCPSCYVDCGKRVMTDASGRFTIKNLSTDLVFELLVVRDGYFSALEKSVDPTKGPAPVIVLKTRQPVDDPQRVVRGRVVNSHGRPLRDAVVRPQGILFDDAQRNRVSTYGAIAGLDSIAVTNEKGEFEISYDRPLLKALLLVEARGFAPKLFNQLPAGLDRQTLMVSEGATVRGRLVRNGKPVAGVQMGLIARQRSMGADLKLRGSPYDEIRVGAKADGTFAMTNVPVPVEWYLYGRMESIAAQGATGSREVNTTTDNQDLNVGDIQVAPGYRLRGKVILSDGKPIAGGMRVSISADGSDDTQTALLEPGGAFEFAGLAAGKYQVWASVKGYQGVAWDYRSGRPRPGTVQIQGNTDGFVLELNPRNPK